MPLTLNSSYQNVGFDYILDGVRDLLVTEFNYGKIYIGPELKFNDPFQIRLWLSESSTDGYNAISWQKEYTIDIDLYMIDSNHDENTYKQLHQDTERIYQVLFNNAHKEITVANNSLQWLNGRAETIGINEFEGDEEDVEGLLKSTLSFTCNVHAGQLTSDYSTKSLAFDGTLDYVAVGDSNDFSFGNASNDSAFSVSAWIRPSEATQFRIVSKANDTNSEWQLTIDSSDKLALLCYDSTTSNNITRPTTTSIQESVWTFVTATYDGGGAESGINVYINGSLDNGTAAENGTYVAMHNLASNLNIGYWDDVESFATGNIDEVSIWDTVLTQSAITELYNGGKPKDIRLGTFKHLFDSYCKGYWRMGDGTLDTYPLIADQTNPTLGSELVSSLVNDTTYPFDIFTDNGGGSYTCTHSGSGYKGFESNTFTIAVGDVFKISCTLTNTSGTDTLTVFIGDTAVGSSDETGEATHSLVEGDNVFYTSVDTASSTSRLVSQINSNTVFTISNISVKKVNGNPGLMTNMTSADIETETP